MAYGVISDIEGLLPWKFTDQSRPTRGQVETMLDRHSATVDAELAAKGIAVPLQSVSSRGYKFCTQIVLYKTCADILRFRAMEENEGQHLSLAQYYDQLAAQLLESLKQAPQTFVET